VSVDADIAHHERAAPLGIFVRRSAIKGRNHR
jgi:hypothetical protein